MASEPETIFAVGDIHGQREALDRALEFIARDPAAGAPVIFLGDYVDRGPDTRGVIDRLIAGHLAGRDWTFLRGNHEMLMLDFLFTSRPLWRGRSIWLTDNGGGRATARSYGVDVDPRRRDSAIRADLRDAVPETHLRFLGDLALSHETGELFCCHAGIRPGVSLDAQEEDDLLWIREPFLSATGDHGKLIVHGHTPIDGPCHYGNRVNLDGGAGYGRPIWPVVFEGRQAFQLTEAGRCRL